MDTKFKKPMYEKPTKKQADLRQKAINEDWK